MDKKLKIFFWIGILFILIGIAFGTVAILGDTWRISFITLGGMGCLILGVVDLIVVGILLGKRTKATVPRSQRQ